LTWTGVLQTETVDIRQRLMVVYCSSMWMEVLSKYDDEGDDDRLTGIRPIATLHAVRSWNIHGMSSGPTNCRFLWSK